MARKKNGEKELYWRDLINRQSVSDMSIKGFCAAESVSRPSFYAWRRRLGQVEDNGTGAQASTSHEAGRGGQPAFIPLKLLESPGGLEIIHPHGCHVRVIGGVDAHVLRQVLDVLDGRGAG